MTMSAVWTIEVDGSSRKYKDIDFDRKLEMTSPTSFTALIKYDGDVEFFDVIQIKKNGTVEWRGFVETIIIKWDESGRYYEIAGRDNTVILWKKMNENFVNQHEGTDGFFGSVSATELIKFLLRCPKSDEVYDDTGIIPVERYPHNKAGWGIDSSKFTYIEAGRQGEEGYGDPHYTVLRKRGLGWTNTGNPYADDTLEVASVTSNNWTTHGSTPYLANKDNTDYISSATVGQIASFKFGNLTINATSIRDVKLVIGWKPDATPWWWLRAELKIEISTDGGSTWYERGRLQGKGNWLGQGWIYSSIDVDLWFNSPATMQSNNACVRFTIIDGTLSSSITYAALEVLYAEGGEQKALEDYFAISFAETSVVGIYVESRGEDLDAYPRNYSIVYVADTFLDWSTFVETDPNSHITIHNEATPSPYLDFHQYTNEVAKEVRDYTVDGIQDFDWRVKVTLDSTQYDHYNLPCFIISNNDEGWYAMKSAGHYYIALSFISSIVETSSTAYTRYLKVKSEVNIPAGYQTDTSTAIFSVGTSYVFRIVRFGTSLKFYILNEGQTITLYTKEFVITSNYKFRYRMHANCYNYGTDHSQWSMVQWEDGDGFEDTNTFNHSGKIEFYDVYGYDEAQHSKGSHSVKLEGTTDGGMYFTKEVGGCNRIRADIDWMFHQGPDSEAVNTNLAVEAWHFEHNDWTHVNTEPWLHNDDWTDYISIAIASSSLNKYDEYYTFIELDAKYDQLSMTGITLDIKGKIVGHTGGDSAFIYVYGHLGGGTPPYDWTLIGTMTFAAAESTQSLDISSLIPNNSSNIANINSLAIKILFEGFTGNEDGSLNLTYANIHVEGTAYWGTLILMKIFDKDYVDDHENPWTIQCLAWLEARTNQNAWEIFLCGYDGDGVPWEGSTGSNLTTIDTWYRIGLAVDVIDGRAEFWLTNALVHAETGIHDMAAHTVGGNADAVTYCIIMSGGIDGNHWLDNPEIRYGYTISEGTIYSMDEDETELVNVTNNTYRDIIHSWDPITLKNLKIKITDDATYPWTITQVYIYKAEDLDYRIWCESGTPSFPLNQYVQAVLIDDTYAPPVGPLNIPEGRVLDSINLLIKNLAVSHIPYQWWMAYDSTNTVHIADRKGSDISATVKFEFGSELGGNAYEQSIGDTIQRMKLSGGGDGDPSKSSSWKTSVPAAINTFYEGIETEKSIGNHTVANGVADVYLEESKNVKEQIKFSVTKDKYDSMDYDTGDDVTVTDSLTGITGSHLIYNLMKKINDDGENITIVVGSPWKDIEETWADIYSRLAKMERAGVIKPDWAYEGSHPMAIDPTAMITLFEKTGQSDTITTGSNDDDYKWYKAWSGWAGYGPRYGGPPNGIEFEIGDDKGYIKGPTSTVGKNYMLADISNSEFATTETLNIPIMANPKMSVNIRLFEDTGVKAWNDGDTLDIGFKNNHSVITLTSTTDGFWFRIVKDSGHFDIYAVWSGTTSPYGNQSDPMFIRSLTENLEYRLQITVDASLGRVYYDVYDVTNNATYPISAVCLTLNTNGTVFPFHIGFEADNNGDPAKQLICFFKNLKVEYLKNGTDLYSGGATS